jgi:hypothetical protein
MIAIDTHEAYASVKDDNAVFELTWVSPRNFILMTNAKRKVGLRGFPMYATAYDGVVYVWPINDGSAKIWWRPKTWRKP